MGKYSIEIGTIASKEILSYYQSGDQKTITRLERIFKELSEHPEVGIGSPERLRHQLSGYWSRRLNRKDRIIYRIIEESAIVLIVSAKGHYLK